MTTAAEMIADLQLRLDDAGDTKFSESQKILLLNRGQAAMYPKIYQTVRDTTLAIVANTYEYSVPASVGAAGQICSIEIEDETYADTYNVLQSYQVLYGLSDPVLKLLDRDLPSVGQKIRISSILPLTKFATSASVYTGPAVSEELPVLYAMSLASSALVEQRMRMNRMPTVEGINGIHSGDFMTAAQFWMQQFETLLDQLAMPIPQAF